MLKTSVRLVVAVVLGASVVGLAALLVVVGPAEIDGFPGLAGVLAAEPPTSLYGRVVDLGDGRSVAGATVLAGDESTVTGADGRFRLALAPGEYDVRVESDGYSAATIIGRSVGVGASRLDVGLPPNDPGHEAMIRAASAVRAEKLRAMGGVDVNGDESVGELQADGFVRAQAVTGVTEVPDTIRVLMPDEEIVEMEMDTYLKGVVPSEMGYVFRRTIAALEAQAIASRTYAATRCLPETAGDPDECEPGLDANVDTTTRTQVWRPVHYDVSDAAVNSTRRQVVRYQGELVHALFHARSLDHTLNSEDSRCCGGREWPYLRSSSSPDPFEKSWGHQAGMSQEGAAVLADWGSSAEEILRHYYAGTTIDEPSPITPTVQAALFSDSGTSGEASERGDQHEDVAAPSVLSGEETFTAPEMNATGVSVLDRASAEDGALLITAESPVVQSEFEFGALAVRWEGDAEVVADVSVEVRTSHEGESWSEWATMHVDVAMADAPAPNQPGEIWSTLLIQRGRFAQLKVSAPATPGGPKAVDRVTLHYLNADDGPEAPRLTTAANGLAVVSRGGWGANESYRFDDEGEEIWPPEYHAPRAQIVHHTVTANQPSDPAAIVRSIYYYHAVTRGWGDIGYNFLVDHRGNVYEGRYGGEPNGRTVRGGHALQFNEDTIGVAVMGTFTESSSAPTWSAQNALVELLAVKGVAYTIEPFRPVNIADTDLPYSVLGHRDVLPGHTACPGDGLHALLSGIRTRVAQRMTELEPAPWPTATTRPSPTRQLPPTATHTQLVPSTVQPTHEPTIVASATPLPASCSESVEDGGFEELSTAWVRNRAYFTTWNVHSGAVAMFVGLRHDDEDVGTTYASVSQTVQLPAEVGQSRLTFMARTSGFDGDRMVVRILDVNGATIALSQVQLPSESAWTRWTFDVGNELVSSGGEKIRVYFATINNGDGQKSYLRLDDVSFVVCEPDDTWHTETPTSTPSRTSTSAPTSTSIVPGATRPSVTSTPGPTDGPSCVDVLSNGGFDQPKLSGWDVTGGHAAIRLTRSGQSGDGSLRLGPLAGEAFTFDYAAAAQSFSAPSEVISATLKMRTNVLSSASGDTFVVEFRKRAVGSRMVLLGPAVGEVGLWSRHVVPIDPATVTDVVELYFAVLNRAHQAAGGGRTVVLVDDVELMVCSVPKLRSRHLPWATGTRH